MSDDEKTSGRMARNKAKAEKLLRNHGTEALVLCNQMIRRSRLLSKENRHWRRIRRHLHRLGA